ncbi:MAG: carboxypeptidase-like regulatory domain-containing protein [Bryobacteraceae bacterium]|jgi:hypothetical protein
MNVMPVFLLAAQLAVFQNSPTPQEPDVPPGSLSGQVVNALTGEPVSGARVMVQCASRNSGYSQAVSDRGGMFNAAGLGPGSCTITANHREYTGIMGLGQPAATAEISSGNETSGVQVKLMPGGVIGGRVVNDDGEPVEGCFIQAYSPLHLGDASSLQQRSGVQTDDQGEFRLAGLTADRYLVHAQCQESLPVERLLGPSGSRPEEPRESWLPVFYPDSPAASGATVLSVMPGTELQNIEFRLKTTPVVTVRGSLMSTPGQNLNVQLFPDAATGDTSQPLGGAYDQKDGTFRIDFVSPGSYRLVASSMSGQPDTMALAELRLTTGTASPEPVLLQLQSAPALKGVVEDPAGTVPDAGTGADQQTVIRPRIRQLGTGRQPQQPQAEPPKGWVQVMPETPNSPGGYRQGDVHQDGSFEVKGLGPGRYRVRYQSATTAAFVDSMQYGATRLERDEIEIAAGAPGLLRIVLGAKGARVQIHLPEDSSPGKTTVWTVFLAPAGRSFWPGAGMPMLMGASGTDLSYDNLAPGKYFVFAVQQSQNFGFNERVFELVQSRLEAVDIAVGGSPAITPKLFTSGEITRLALAFLQGENQ